MATTYLDNKRLPKHYVVQCLRDYIPVYLTQLRLSSVCDHISAQEIAQGLSHSPLVMAISSEDEFLGVCILDVSLKPVAVIQHFYVLPSRLREVSPRAMVRAAEELSRDLGCTILMATTGLIKQNTQRNLYSRTGFTEVGSVYRKDLQ